MSTTCSRNAAQHISESRMVQDARRPASREGVLLWYEIRFTQPSDVGIWMGSGLRARPRAWISEVENLKPSLSSP